MDFGTALIKRSRRQVGRSVYETITHLSPAKAKTLETKGIIPRVLPTPGLGKDVNKSRPLFPKIKWEYVGYGLISPFWFVIFIFMWLGYSIQHFASFVFDSDVNQKNKLLLSRVKYLEEENRDLLKRATKESEYR